MAGDNMLGASTSAGGQFEMLARLAQILGDNRNLPATLAAQAMELHERLAAGRLHLAVLGQFKRGKSTLINALLGADVLPVGVLPVTAVPTFLRFAATPLLQVRYADGRRREHHPPEMLAQFVTEVGNPHNHKRVQQVELYFPAPLLKHEIVLIDTPGVGSTHEHNTATTLGILPRCDAALVVLSADPPITAAEVAFLQQVQSHVGQFFFVLNKVDYLESQAVTEAVGFLVGVLESTLGLAAPRIFTLSAEGGLRARLQGERDDWLQSGVALLEEALLAFAAHGKQAALQQAVRRKSADLITEALQLLALRERALRLPLETLDEKIAAFQAYAVTARARKQEVSDRLEGDHKRLRAWLEASAQQLRRRAQDELGSSARAPIADWAARLQQEIEQFFDRQRAALRDEFRGRLIQVLAEWNDQLQELREALRREAATLLEIPYRPFISDEALVEAAQPYWDSLCNVSLRLTPSLWERWLPPDSRQRRQARRRQQLLEELAVRNVEKVRWWLIQSLDESVRRFRSRVDAEMETTIRQIDQALQAGRVRREAQAGKRQAQLDELAAQQAQLRELLPGAEQGGGQT